MHSTIDAFASDGEMMRWTTTTDICPGLDNGNHVISAAWLTETVRCVPISEMLM